MTDKKKADRFAVVAQNVSKMQSEPTLSPAPQAATAPKMGRPRGKKSDPDYVQVTVYLRKSVHQTAKKLLIDQEREFSELVDDLVSRWVDNPEV